VSIHSSSKWRKHLSTVKSYLLILILLVATFIGTQLDLHQTVGSRNTCKLYAFTIKYPYTNDLKLFLSFLNIAPAFCRLLPLALSTLLLHTLASNKASGLLFNASEALTCVSVGACCLHCIDRLFFVLNSRGLPRFVACDVANSLLQSCQYILTSLGHDNAS
jgi:hypothetical protein